ncbi:hypothetical protein ACP6DW_34000, partial [Klebsiella pneumoniae subsp. pneumoniae]
DTNPASDTLRHQKPIHNLQRGLQTETPEIQRLPVQPDARNDRKFWRTEKKPQLLKTAAQPNTLIKMFCQRYARPTPDSTRMNSGTDRRFIYNVLVETHKQ